MARWKRNTVIMQHENNTERIKLAHGSGGALSHELLETVIYPYFKSNSYSELNDAATFDLNGNPVFTTDSYVVDPPFFPGGDIGKLAVFGTCNDLSVSGGKPRFLSLGMIIEEGFGIENLKRILSSIKKASETAGVSIVTGDTKVLPGDKEGGIFINTAGIGERHFSSSISCLRIERDDRIILSGPIGSHGIAVLSAREKLPIKDIQSDCAFLHPLCEKLYRFGSGVRFMRDVTRGGVSAILNETCFKQPFGIVVFESAIPVLPPVQAAADILGLNPLEIANEGVLIAVVSPNLEEEVLAALHTHPIGAKAASVGVVTGTNPGQVLLETSIGSKRVLDFPRGLLLPRIC